MDKKEKKINKIVEDLTMDSIVNLLERWDMAEFVDFVKDKQLDGRKLMVRNILYEIIFPI